MKNMVIIVKTVIEIIGWEKVIVLRVQIVGGVLVQMELVVVV